MNYPFPPRSGLIEVDAEISGPSGTVAAVLMLDTGATNTALNLRVPGQVGYDPASSTDLVRLTAGTGSATVPRLMVNRLTELGRHAIGPRVVEHDLPLESGVDGLLGLEFFRDLLLSIDFRAGQISLA